MHEGLLIMMELSDAFIALPGGFGSLEELFQMISWAQLNIHSKPICVLNINGFFNGLLSFVDHAVEQKFITQRARKIRDGKINPTQWRNQSPPLIRWGIPAPSRTTGRRRY
ncbi:hypothetical protein PTKIN_Ptkin03bG0213500 [Pterospermum kingtungense]